MIDIENHPIWRGINPLKKKGHLLRISLARQFAKLIPRQKFIGITGSVGKSTTVLACKAVLETKYKTITTTPNLDTVFNLPITILKTRPSTEKVVLELGIEYPGEMEWYLTLAQPSTAIVTRISPAHTEFLGTVDDIAREKGRLVKQLPKTGAAILNYDDPNTRALADNTQARVIFYGTDPENCHVWADNIRIQGFQTFFGLHFGAERLEIKSNLLGQHQIYPLLAAAALGLESDVPFTKIRKALESVQSPPRRMQVVEGHNGSFIIDDTYNSSPAAVEEALETLNLVPARRRILVLGEMRELGHQSEKLHRQIAQKIFTDKPDLVLLGTGDVKYVADELFKLGFIPERLEPNMRNQDIVSSLLKILAKGDVVLIKGSHAVRLDEVVERIAKTG